MTIDSDNQATATHVSVNDDQTASDGPCTLQMQYTYTISVTVCVKTCCNACTV